MLFFRQRAAIALQPLDAGRPHFCGSLSSVAKQSSLGKLGAQPVRLKLS